MHRTIKMGMGIAASLLLAGAAFAADVKVTGVHNCCPGCTMNITETLTKAGATNVKVEKQEISFTSDTPAPVLRALYAAGYAGKVEGDGVRQPGIRRNLADVKGKSLKFEGIHACCGACVAGINKALAPLGKTDIKAKATSFTVTSENEISADQVVKALRDAGFNARPAAQQ